MKIVCDNCATKYSIADEKVRGKVFKIRCKKCSHIIVVKGNEGGAAEVGSQSGDVPAEAMSASAASMEAAPADGWHVVINGEQVGPLSPQEIRAKFSAGEIDAESYAWREGFGDWQRLASIDEFNDLQPAAPAADATKRSSADNLFGGGAAPAQPAGNNLFGAPSGDAFAGGQPSGGGGGGLFAQGEPAAQPKRSPTPGFGQPAMMGDAPPAAEAKMTGARNESSVLFSLNNLQALASGGGAPAKTPGQSGNSGGGVSASGEQRPGFANSQTEGSGLIDIRAMAAATLSSGPSSSESKPNNLPSFSSAPVFSPIAAPILMPSAPSGPPKWIWPVIALGITAVAGMVVVTVLMLRKQPDAVAVVNPAVATGGAAAPAAAGATAGGATAAPTPTPAANTGAPTPTPNTAAATPDKGGDEKGDRPDKGGRPTKGGSAKAAAKGTPATSPTATAARKDDPPAPTPAAPVKKGGKKDELDDLLNGASPEKPKAAAREDRPAPSGGNDENLPDQLDKTAIVSGMKKVTPKVQGCYEQYKVPGLANVAVTIGKNGRVSQAAVSGSFAGTPTGDCVGKAVKGATFSPFKGSPQTINYPFSLR